MQPHETAGGICEADTMTDPASPKKAPRRLRRAKREAIEQAGLRVFGRLGYTRASIDLIAEEAGVSTRTIYNHFENKLRLFSAVLVASATRVADAFIDEVGAGFSGAGPETDLIVLAQAIIAHHARFPEHFALVGRISAETDQFPPEIIDAWLQAGPRRVRAAIVTRLQQLGEAGCLTITDPQAAARHLVALVNSERLTNPQGGSPPSDAEIAANVHVFLHGYAKPGS
jgi:AcrR family transcriptional regulator